jgi:hypothetical protein
MLNIAIGNKNIIRKYNKQIENKFIKKEITIKILTIL